MEDLRNDLTTRHSEDVSRIKEENFDDAQKMLQDFEHGQSFLRSKISDLEKQLKEAALKYIHRESRDEDVALINELQRLLDEQQEKTRQYEVSIF